MSLLSTGQAAKLCAVTPDTVLKWIKAGKIQAQRTAGGHYRIPRKTIDALLAPPAETGPGVPSDSSVSRVETCWEFHSRNGMVREDCQQCLVFRSRALRCYEMSHLGAENGHQRTFCQTTCDKCDYFQQVRPAPIRVLVVTNSEGLEQSLRQTDDGWFEFQFTSCEYDCSAMVGSFSPECVVVDCSLPPEQCQALCQHLSQDPRLAGATILLAGTPADSLDTAGADTALVRTPLTPESLREKLDEISAAMESGGDTMGRPHLALECAIAPS